MSRIVGCAGTSHSPMLALPPNPGWQLRAAADETGVTELVDHYGERRKFSELADQAGTLFIDEMKPEVWDRKYSHCMDAIARLGEDVRTLDPDLLIIIGDDQEEVFTLRNNPSIAISYAATIPAAGAGDPAQAAGTSFRQGLGLDGTVYPGSPDVAVQLITELVEYGFDITAVGDLDGTSGFGHAYTWVLGRLLRGARVPSIPVLLNTYYPPNQPTPKRCFELGVKIREICESIPGDLRIVVIASGGLSHFVVNSELDEAVLTAIREHDAGVLQRLPASTLNSGTSEIRNWIAMSGSSDGLTTRWTEYQPVYRTRAGTGCGLAFTLLS